MNPDTLMNGANNMISVDTNLARSSVIVITGDRKFQ